VSRRDRAADRAIRDLAVSAGSRVAAVQLELTIPDERPRREQTFPEFLGEGQRRARVLGEANDRLEHDRSEEAYAAAAAAQVAFDEMIGEHIMGGIFREVF